MTDKRIVLGVDGGGTRTRVAVTTVGGRVLGIGTSGPGNYHNVGADLVQHNIEEALQLAWSQAEQTPVDASAAFLGLGSIVSDQDRCVIQEIAGRLNLAPGNYIGVDHDLRIALAGGLAGQPGIVLITGTGSSCYGRTTMGDSWRAGGWGPMLSDEGSGYWLASQAMIAAVRSFDGRGHSTNLQDRVLEALGLQDIQKIMHRVDAVGLSRRETASLAKIVTEAAGTGDAVARQIIHRGASELALAIGTVARKLDFATPVIPVTVTGGLTEAGEVFMGPLRHAVQQMEPACHLTEGQLPPVLGAALLAIKSLNVDVTDSTVANLKASLADAYPSDQPRSMPC